MKVNSPHRRAALRRALALATALGCRAAHAQAQPPEDELGDVGRIFEEQSEVARLLHEETSVASTVASTVRETPGIVTLISREEIDRSGAKDLLQILERVPGFQPALDVQGVVDLGFRGNWGHEGKILLVLDGVEMNEQLYSTNQLGMHYPADAIEQVEVVRGPGSAQYGGNAELAVVRVTTRTAASLQGGAVTVRYGAMGRGPGSRVLTAAVGGTTDAWGGLEGSALLSVGEGAVSDRTFTDAAGASYPMADNAANRPFLVSLGARSHGLSLRLLHDSFQVVERDSYGTSNAAPVAMDFLTTAAQARYDLELWGGRLKLSPSAEWKRQAPWRVLDQSVPDFYDKEVQRLTARLMATVRVLEGLSVTVGGEAYSQRAWVNQALEDNPSAGNFRGRNEVTYRDAAALAEVDYRSSWVNLLGGLRFEAHDQFGHSLVPRLAATKAWDVLHVKALLSQAFRAPGVENARDNPDIRPERTRALELEAGARVGDWLFVTANVFDLSLSDVIVYGYDAATDAEYYLNQGSTGTRGSELEARVQTRWGYLAASYAYQTAAGNNRVELYQVPDHPEVLLGFAQHQVSVRASVPVGQHVSIDPSAVILGPRFGYLSVDADGNPVLGQAPAVALVNVYATARDLGLAGLELQLGVSNLLDQNRPYIQPYNSGHTPLPGPGREVSAKASLRLP